MSTAIAEKVKHTPGPWKFMFGQTPETVGITTVPPNMDTQEGKGWNSKAICISNENNELLAEVKSYTTEGYVQDFDQWAANCKLISAAPELLEALRMFTDFPEEDINGWIEDDRPITITVIAEAFLKAKAAIQKATSL